MYNICTTIEQSKKLIELGIDVNTAYMCYCPIMNIDLGKNEGYLKVPECYPFYEVKDSLAPYLPTWSLSALMELMNRNCYNVSLNCHGAEWNIKFDDSEKYKDFTKDYSVDAAYEMVCWLLENKKL